MNVENEIITLINVINNLVLVDRIPLKRCFHGLYFQKYNYNGKIKWSKSMFELVSGFFLLISDMCALTKRPMVFDMQHKTKIVTSEYKLRLECMPIIINDNFANASTIKRTWDPFPEGTVRFIDKYANDIDHTRTHLIGIFGTRDDQRRLINNIAISYEILINHGTEMPPTVACVDFGVSPPRLAGPCEMVSVFPGK